MITVPFQKDGPDLDAIEDLLSKESNVHGIVCVPRHSNPTGHTFSDGNVQPVSYTHLTLPTICSV